MTRLANHIIPVACAVAVCAAGLLVAPPAALAATGCDTGAMDFDGNGGTDLAIGAPYAEDHGVQSGVVDVRMKMASGVRRITLSEPGAHHADDGFGFAVGDVDLSPHSDASMPCSDLVVGEPGAIFVFAWDEDTQDFTLLHKITRTEVDPNLYQFGTAIATQTEGSTGPTARQPVLYVGAPLATVNGINDQGAVARLVLTPQGTVASKQIIEPGRTATSQMPLTLASAVQFGETVLGTPDADEAIIGDYQAHVAGNTDAGAVLDWHRGSGSTLITENTPGVPGTAEKNDQFGRALWMSTESSDVAGIATSLYVGVPGETLGSAYHAGAALQFRYPRSGSSGAVSTSGVRAWSQNAPGVGGIAEKNDLFGSSFQSLTVGGGPPKIVVGVPGETVDHIRGTGIIDVLGDGRTFDSLSVGQNHLHRFSGFGAALGAWHDEDDYLADDPFPRDASGQWPAQVVVGDIRRSYAFSGLPAGGVTSSTTFSLTHDECTRHEYCGYANSITASNGG